MRATPLAYLLSVMHDADADPARRDWAARVAAPYVNPRVQSLGKKAQRAVAAEDAERGSGWERLLRRGGDRNPPGSLEMKRPRLSALKPTLRAISTAVAAPARSTGDAKAYASPEHRAWRAAVLARAGHACQACGRTGVRLFADHIHELRDGGAALDVANGQALCGGCHSQKTAAARAARQQR